jgi:biotin-dependent carboxylase-like uncharacterized protein
VALRIGNLLVGNDEGAAGIEVQTFPFELRFERDTQIAVTGAQSDRSRLGTRPLMPWWSFIARAGDLLTITHPQQGARSYVTVGGGIDVPEVLGSRSTHLRNAFGGLAGRALTRGDHLTVVPHTPRGMVEVGVTPPHAILSDENPVGELSVRAIPGADFEIFPEAARRAFFEGDWKITSQSDRTGYRLKGEPLLLDEHMELRSYGLVAGIVQVPPSGQPIVQMADANTAGGYPRLAGVIEADLWRLAQAPLGSRLRFIQIDYPDAVAALRPMADYLADVRHTIRTTRGALLRRAT